MTSPKHKFRNQFFRFVVLIGNIFTVLGCLGLLFGLIGVINFDDFSFGLSSGIRIIGSLAIAGCLLNAIGHTILDFTQTD